MSSHEGEISGSSQNARALRLEGEVEQLRVAVEDAREEAAALAAERDALAAAARERARELHEARAMLRAMGAMGGLPFPGQGGADGVASSPPADDAEAEKLRVALEELQVMAEELEVSNASLRRNNDELDAHVAQRTAALAGANEALRASEERARLILDSATDQAILTFDADGLITSWNSGAEILFGWPAAQAVGAHIDLIFTAQDRDSGVARERMAQAATHGRAIAARWHRRRDGTLFWAECELLPLRQGAGEAGGAPGFLKILRDRTEQRRMEQALREALEDRDLLMREVHHRVKNSLQLVQGLLNAQARAASHGSSAAVQLAESAARVRTIAAMHDRLYRADPGRVAVEVRPYLDGLIADLRSAMASTLAGRDVQLVVEGEAAWPAAAVPALGLVATELVTNALKYGAGTVRVRFSPATGTGPATLVVEDEGTGLPEDFDPAGSHGLGMRLVQGLLRGEGAGLEVDRASPHTRFVVRLPLSGDEGA